MSHDWEKCLYCLTSGDMLTVAAAEALDIQLSDPCLLILAAGSAEVAADCTCQDVHAYLQRTNSSALSPAADGNGRPVAATDGVASAWVPVGRPISGMQVAIVSCESGSDDQESPDGVHHTASSHSAPCLADLEVIGEVWVAGIGLAAGYHNNSSATAARFRQLQVPLHPCSIGHGALPTQAGGLTAATDAAGTASKTQQCRWFCTGDIGRMLADGESAGWSCHAAAWQVMLALPGQLNA